MQITEADRLIFFISSAIIFILVVFFLIIIINNFRKNARKHQEDIRLIFNTQEEERDRIARDLHDGIGALLSAAKLHTELLEEQGSKAEIAQTAKSISSIIDQAIDDLRSTVRQLVPRNIAEKGWLLEIEELIKRINNSNKQQISIKYTDPELRFSHEIEMNLYRIVQELINNSVKHSGAKEIRIIIENKDGNMRIEVSDNGKGITSSDETSGHGLKNIEARLHGLNGTLEITKSDTGGACFTIQFIRGNLF